MSFFTSNRERRLWLWTLTVIAGIYSTLSFTPTLAGILRDHNMLSNTFWLGMFLIGVAILALGLKTRPRGIEIGVGLGVMAVYTIVLARLTIPEERSHIIEYTVVALFIYEALKERASQGRHVPKPALLAILLTTLVGLLDETIQIFLPNRVFDFFDILFNFLSAVMAVGGCVALNWAKQLTFKKWRSHGGTPPS